MALNFPDSPTLGQVYTDSTSGFSYEWDGVVWKSYSAASVSNIRSIDDISSGFDGTTTLFALTSGGVAVTPLTDNQIIVNLGGIIQDPVDDYNIVGSNILFTTAPEAGLSFSATLLGTSVPIDYATGGNVYERQTYTATAGQTSFTFTNGYTVGYFDVYRNGVKLLSGSDYTATSGSGFTLTVPAQLNDEIEAIAYKIKSFVTSEGDILNLNVAGIATISSNTFINNTGINVTGVITATSASVGSGVTINSTGINVTGVLTATSFSGDGSNLTNTGSTLSAASGSQRLVVTSLTSGAMTSAATDADLTWNSTTNTLSATNVSIAGTLTYEDVTNVDSIGIVTARSGVRINTGGLVVTAGVSTLTTLIPDETRFVTVAEKLTRIDGNTVNLTYSSSGSNIGLATNPSGDITLNVSGIPTSSDFDNHVITFSVFVTNTGTARSCTAINLNGVSRTINWAGGSLEDAISGVTTSNGIDIYSFTGINTVGSASTTDNYRVLGVVNGGYR